MKKLFTALFITIITSNTSLFTWGQIGHRVVGDIAQKYLDPIVLKKVNTLLEGRDLAMVSNWCDHIKSFKKHDHTFWWHFVNVEDGKRYSEVTHNKNGDIVEAIQRFSKQLANDKLSFQKRHEALKWLVHLLGDIHQPLHVGYAKDQGGNLISVKWFGKKSNLHAVWDEGIINHQELSYTELSKLINFTNVEQLKKLQNSDVNVWLNEGMKLRKRVYDLKSKELSYAYQAHNVEFLNSQLLKAGIRLAGLLNKVLK
ncbi:MAG: S1/P1 Nuclease [Candidatus Cloacimonadota bacterium]|nr:MAG: S1/P1 Nuclease [Candidatus Cloacimonadota bacterium]